MMNDEEKIEEKKRRREEKNIEIRSSVGANRGVSVFARLLAYIQLVGRVREVLSGNLISSGN